ncbi:MULTISPECIES: hypothetical protein [Lactococcus]|uniref:hypothetical protein n=1 Tax=Lactococcus TaxID=1357 RepID=UPI001F3A7011|nr:MULTISPECIES: hypothetical protein [Lactococcus]
MWLIFGYIYRLPECYRKTEILEFMFLTGLRIHMLRHFHISLLVEMNRLIKAITEGVGHSDEKMIVQVCSPVTPNMQHDLNSKLNELNF